MIEAMNPTSDGPIPEKSLSSPRAIERYLRKVCDPLIDRFDMQVELPVVSYMTLCNETEGDIPLNYSGASVLQLGTDVKTSRTKLNKIIWTQAKPFKRTSTDSY